MTISTTTIKNSYSGNASTTAFNYTFKITAESEMQVIIRSSAGTETVKTLSTHYTISGVGSSGGGTVTFTAGNTPASTETVILRRVTAQTQSMDLIDNDPMSANTIENAHDKAIAITQELQEQVNRSLKISRTNTMTSTEFTVDATNRANKILAFDSAGEISVTQELGNFKGSDATTTTVAYVQRDIIKSTTTPQLNNVYICVADSVIGDLLTDTDHFELLVDAVTAATSAATATTKASEAASSATDAQTAQTAAETAETNAETAQTNAETAQTNAETAETNAETAQTAAELAETNAGTSETNAASSESSASSSASTATTQAGIATTQAGIATTQASNASTSASNAATSATNAGTSENNAATSETNASNSATTSANEATASANSATASANSASAAAASFDLFDDSYLGAKASNPTLDNDGNALQDGALYFDTNNDVMKVYDLATTTWLQLTPTVSNQNNINAVNANSVNINAVANDATDIGTVATNLAGTNTIGTVAGAIANVDLVGGSITNVNQVGSNIGTVNEFGERYRVASADPTTNLDEGDLAYNSTANTLKYYNGSAWITIVAGSLTDIVQDGTPQLGGNLDTQSFTVDGRDVSTDGTKLDTIETNATANPNAIDNVVEDTAPQLGGNLDLNGNNISGTGGIPSANLTGTVANARLTGSGAITINGSSVALGGTVTVGTTWESKSADFTAVSGKAYFIDTSAQGVTVTLPASPTIGDEIRILDVKGTFDTYGLAILRNGEKIQGVANDLSVTTERAGFSLVYYDTNEGWLLMEK